MSLTELTSLKELAIAAYGVGREEQEQHQREKYTKRTEMARQAFVRIFGIHPGTISTDAVSTEALHDGLHFQAYPNSYDKVRAFRLLGICPTCFTRGWSRPIYNLAELGEMLEEFNPDYDHKCRAEKLPTTAADRVAEAILDLIQNREE